MTKRLPLTRRAAARRLDDIKAALVADCGSAPTATGATLIARAASLQFECERMGFAQSRGDLIDVALLTRTTNALRRVLEFLAVEQGRAEGSTALRSAARRQGT